MGSLKALQDWCRVQCESYPDVEIKNMSSSFRDGLAFCAIIHRHRPDLIDFTSLSKENVYKNNQLAFEVAESELNIPALLDPEDMVSMSVPDRLSIITYVSQYYNYFTNKYQDNSTYLKRPACPGYNEPVIKKPSSPEEQVTKTELGADSHSTSNSLSSSCLVCGKHVHLVQRILIDGKLYHRNCFRCRECSNTLLPGSYKFTEDAGSLVCTHHFTRSTSQNCHSDLSNQIVPTSSSPKDPKDPPNRSIQLIASQSDDKVAEREDENSERHETLKENQPDSSSEEKTEQVHQNPFDESEEEQDTQQEDEAKNKLAADGSNGVLPSTPVRSSTAEGPPVPKPRRVFEPSPAPRPVPRPRPLRPSESLIVNGDPSRSVPVPRERSHSPAGKATDTPKPKDPPWLALVQSEPKKKTAPLPPTSIPSLASSGSASSLIEERSEPVAVLNPFDDDDDENGEPETNAEPPLGSVVASHPWYRITQAAKDTDGDASGKSPAASERPVSVNVKKRPAPRAPKLTSLALRKESISSSYSDCSAVPHQPPAYKQDHLFMKSVSEPSINTSSTTPNPEHHPHCSPSRSPAPPPTNTSSMPSTPETGRSMRQPPPRPSSQTPSTPAKQTCKENPFNRKTTTSISAPISGRPKGPRPARPPAPGHGFPLIKRKVQSDQYIPVEDVHSEISHLEKELDELEKRGVDLEKRLRDCSNDDEEEHLLVDWFTLIHEKHLLVRREAELVYTAKQQNLEERQADVEYELRCLLNKPEKEWTSDDKAREQQLMSELVTVIEQRNQIINSMDQDRQREEEEDKLVAAMLKKKEFHGVSEQKKKAGKFKPMKVLKRLSTKSEGEKGNIARKENR